ncbi:MAG: DUF4175 family protein [Alphaproteobacteria bacterium]|nr:DUF4175 family protein [Alphaproteobacteria bacterium]
MALSRPPPKSGRYVRGLDSGGDRPLVAAPEFPLSLAGGERKSGAAETIRDLTSHPWAGSEVDLVLSADHAGQAGYSTPHRFTLPQRRFSATLARAIVEQRRDLALDANAFACRRCLDALMLAPEKLSSMPRPISAWISPARGWIAATTDEELREVVDLSGIWR